MPYGNRLASYQLWFWQSIARACVYLCPCMKGLFFFSSMSSGVSGCLDVWSLLKLDRWGCWLSSSKLVGRQRNCQRVQALVTGGHPWSSFWVGGCGRAEDRPHLFGTLQPLLLLGDSVVPARCPGSQICKRSACRAPLSWCSCHSSSAEHGLACRSSCLAYSCVHPNALPPHLDLSFWIRHCCPPT